MERVKSWKTPRFGEPFDDGNVVASHVAKQPVWKTRERVNGYAGTVSFARNKYVWPRFWPEKHYVCEENMHDELVGQALDSGQERRPIASSNTNYHDSIILSMVHRRRLAQLFILFVFVSFFFFFFCFFDLFNFHAVPLLTD